MTIGVENVSKSYKKRLVLKRISFQLKEGEIYCVIGKNGAGKSTLFNILGGLLKPDEGQVTYDSIAYGQLPKKVKQKIGLLSDVSGLIEELTAYQYLDLIGLFYNVDKLRREQQINKFMNFFFPDAKDMHKLKIKGFSTGMKKKLEIISCSLHLPDLLILDEPFSGLDPLSSENVIDYLHQYKEPYRTILFSSHNVDYIERVDPVIILLDSAEIKFQGKIKEFVDSAGNKFHESLLEAFNYKKSEKSIKWL